MTASAYCSPMPGCARQPITSSPNGTPSEWKPHRVRYNRARTGKTCVRILCADCRGAPRQDLISCTGRQMALRLQQPLDDGLGIALAALHGISFQRRDEDARQICPPRLTGEPAIGNGSRVTTCPGCSSRGRHRPPCIIVSKRHRDALRVARLGAVMRSTRSKRVQHIRPSPSETCPGALREKRSMTEPETPGTLSHATEPRRRVRRIHDARSARDAACRS